MTERAKVRFENDLKDKWMPQLQAQLQAQLERSVNGLLEGVDKRFRPLLDAVENGVRPKLDQVEYHQLVVDERLDKLEKENHRLVDLMEDMADLCRALAVRQGLYANIADKGEALAMAETSDSNISSTAEPAGNVVCTQDVPEST